MRPLQARLLSGDELYREVILNKLMNARESVRIATANVKEMFVDVGAGDGNYRSIIEVFQSLAQRRVQLRLLHAELPSRPFRKSFDAAAKLVEGGLKLKLCPRVHFKTVIVDDAWAYLGSANLTGAGLGAKAADRRNFELGFVTEDFDTIDRTTALFESVWGGAECAACKLRDICPDPVGPEPSKPRRRKAPKGSMGIQLGKSRRLRRGR
jgi:phosphatidylserine/phosphatidylglycerophosphate/cardiolipin synthase-like enzyme